LIGPLIPTGTSSRASCLQVDANPIVIASDSDAIQTKPQLQSLSLDGFALLAMTPEKIRLERDAR
jgi:hypothetical protein